MDRTDLPRPPVQAARPPAKERPGLQEPPTGRALWPTFMRRTLDDDRVRAADAPKPRRWPLGAGR